MPTGHGAFRHHRLHPCALPVTGGSPAVWTANRRAESGVRRVWDPAATHRA